MRSDILRAVVNISNRHDFNVGEPIENSNRANAMGDVLEKYIADAFAGTFEMNEAERIQRQSEVFSYIGNNSNPPDLMIRGGAAIEVKKIENRNSQLQLNSSFPKNKIYANDSRIGQNAVSAENWSEKDFVYAVGFVKNRKIKEIFLVDASIYCANKEIYQSMFDLIKNGVASIPGIVFSQTKELGRVNQIDPLGITNLRARGMWLLENPFSVFSYIYEPNSLKEFNLVAIIMEEKFENSDYKDEIYRLMAERRVLVSDELVRNPNNPAQLIRCKKITYSK